MFGKIRKAVGSLFRRQEKTGGQEETDGQEETRDENKLICRRIDLLTAGLKPYRRRTPQVKRMKVESFTDAYRFLLMLCDKPDFSFHRKGGHLFYVVILPGNAGTLELTDKVRGWDKTAVAILKLHIPACRSEVKEIRFIVNNSKKN